MSKILGVIEMRKLKLNDAINKLVRSVEDNAWKGGMHPDERYDVERELELAKSKLQGIINEVVI